MQAMLRFPAVPALFVCHGWLPWQEAPPRFPSLRRYVAIDQLRRDRLVLEHGISPDRVTVLRNFVDLDRFRPRPPLPARPRRALLFSNQGSASGFGRTVLQACREAGLELDIVGVESGSIAARPQEILPMYDLVFARGRAALEALAVGAAVVLCDVEGGGAMVDTGNLDALRNQNFGLAALRPPVDAARLLAQIARYDPRDAARVSERVRREAGRDLIVSRLVELYEELVADGSDLAGGAAADEGYVSAARYLAWLDYVVDPPLLEAERHLHAEIESRLDESASEFAEIRERLAQARAELTRSREQLDLLEKTPFFRLRGLLLRSHTLIAAYRLLKTRRLGSEPEYQPGDGTRSGH
jgi:hypothetical protein